MSWNDPNTNDPRRPSGQSPWGNPNNNGANNGGPPKPLPPANNNKPPFDFNTLWSQILAMFGGKGFSGVAVLALILGLLILWGLAGFYTVGPNQLGLNRVFGRYTGKTISGLNYNWPYPVGSVEKLNVTDRNSTDIGWHNQEGTSVAAPDESLMLTGDNNIADVKFRVIWQINPAHPEDYAFNVTNQPQIVKAASESAMREIIGHSKIQSILTADRKNIEPAAQESIQTILNHYSAGVLILQVQLLSVDPPSQVIAAFKDVTAAQQEMQKMRNDAEAHANSVVPRARGDAAAIVQQAEANKEQLIADGRGQASLFSQILEQYKKSPELVRERLYLETMERILGHANKVIVDAPVGGAPIPYYSLDQANPAGATK